MTPEEIKNLIDQKIAGQGTMVDVGGALPTILKEIVDMASQGGGGGDIKPIILSALPTQEITTQAELDAIGLTREEINAALLGKRSGVVINTESFADFFTITSVRTLGNDFVTISFCVMEYPEGDSYWVSVGYTIDISGENVTVRLQES